MQSEIRLKAAGFKLYLSIGLCAVAAIVFISYRFTTELSLILYSIGGFFALSGCLVIYARFLTIRHNLALSKIEIERQRQQLRLDIAAANRAEFASRIFTFGHNERALLPTGAEYRVIEVGVRSIENGQPALLPEPHINLMPILERAERVLVKGPSDSGKTTLFQNVAVRAQNVIVIDPHFAPGIWPEHCRIVGAGRNHAEISSFLAWLSTELDRRYKLRANGDESYPILTVIIDEWMSVATRCDNATAVITEMITESRKSKIRLFIGTHSDQVEALGIRGNGKLREGLLTVRLYFDQITRERSATFDYGRGERPCIVPTNAPILIDERMNIFELPKFEPEFVTVSNADMQDAKFVELVKNGQSRNNAANEAYGRGYAGNLVERGKRALGEI
jgi:hypothetical protein